MSDTFCQDRLQARDDIFFYDTTGFSMWPFLRQGTKVVAKKVSAKGLFVGDIILYRQGENLVCHRIIKIKKGQDGITLYIRGDNSPYRHEVVFAGDVVGKVVGLLKGTKIKETDGAINRAINKTIAMVAPLVSMVNNLVKPLYRKIWKRK